MNENVEFRQVAGRWIWTGCAHAAGFPTEDAARAAHTLYPEFYSASTPARRRRQLRKMIDELVRGER